MVDPRPEFFDVRLDIISSEAVRALIARHAFQCVPAEIPPYQSGRAVQTAIMPFGCAIGGHVAVVATFFRGLNASDIEDDRGLGDQGRGAAANERAIDLFVRLTQDR